ncbi:hypothetical protein VKI21_14500 [Cyanobacterium aponinum UTEX 3222]|uniref:DUF304 domain-containing protein n=3 Tax=Cyanobacterium aponinum TaxID=379064 RepID=K9Z514_CYAAP|nr:hypothetical protein [Cyanobacterium aponinum]WRL41246.1 hypothetical protein VKI21_14500 [Cyanobacterium aponinum UTEX 3222]AFZ53832.1 hypothetical protein Cyan10605_1729 [Cyanobacterium aponinum PCC 10605]MBD2395735.1 hypothetical protein [Cyanobacterium aponinum FACHB-4101]MTF39773.1 hypothetical protein [Cyanobacterium aponinum 0216]PHV62195.1 hypothetical protein CSQ80_11460 [Cyanobacterium aponinum IPPAS B-1201]
MESSIYPISPLIKITLLNLYFALTIPLPFLLKTTSLNFPIWLLSLLIGLGAIAIFAILSERVIVDNEGIAVTYPQWVKWLWRKGWHLSWREIDSLKMRTTGQGGLVYYFVSKNRDKAYLLPMRIAGFAKMVQQVQNKTNIDTTDIRPLAQPWMYIFLFFFTFFLWLVDIWTIYQIQFSNLV